MLVGLWMQPGTPSHDAICPFLRPSSHKSSICTVVWFESLFIRLIFIFFFFLYFFFFRVNTRISFYRKKAEMYQAYQCAKADLHNEEYCSWAQEPGMDCDGVGPYNKDFLNELTQFECNLEPVIPQR